MAIAERAPLLPTHAARTASPRARATGVDASASDANTNEDARGRATRTRHKLAVVMSVVFVVCACAMCALTFDRSSAREIASLGKERGRSKEREVEKRVGERRSARASERERGEGVDAKDDDDDDEDDMRRAHEREVRESAKERATEDVERLVREAIARVRGVETTASDSASEKSATKSTFTGVLDAIEAKDLQTVTTSAATLSKGDGVKEASAGAKEASAGAKEAKEASAGAKEAKEASAGATPRAAVTATGVSRGSSSSVDVHLSTHRATHALSAEELMKKAEMRAERRKERRVDARDAGGVQEDSVDEQDEDVVEEDDDEDDDAMFARIEFTPSASLATLSEHDREIRIHADEKLVELTNTANELLAEIQSRMQTRIDSLMLEVDAAPTPVEKLKAQGLAEEKIEQVREETRERVVLIKQKTALRAAMIEDAVAKHMLEDTVTTKLAQRSSDIVRSAIDDKKRSGGDVDTATAKLAQGSGDDDASSKAPLTAEEIAASIEALNKQLEHVNEIQEKQKLMHEAQQERTENLTLSQIAETEAEETANEAAEDEAEQKEDAEKNALEQKVKELELLLHQLSGIDKEEIQEHFALDSPPPPSAPPTPPSPSPPPTPPLPPSNDTLALQERLRALEAALDKAVNGHFFDPKFYRKRPVGLEPDFEAINSYDESGGFYQCEEEETCMTSVTIYRRNGTLYGMKGVCQRGGKALDLATGDRDIFPKHADFDFTDDKCSVNFSTDYRSVYIRREGDDIIAMSTDGTKDTRCGGREVPSAQSVKYECQNPKACITGFHVENRYADAIDGNANKTSADLVLSDVDFVCSDGHYAMDPLLLRDDYGEITVEPNFTVGVAYTPTPAGPQKTVVPYLQLKTHSIVSAAVGQDFLMVVHIRDITNLDEDDKVGWCTTQKVQARLNSMPTCAPGSKLCAKPGYLYNPTGSEFELKFGYQMFNITSAADHESSHVVFENNINPDIVEHLPVKAGEEFFKFGHVYEVCASAIDYSGFHSNITDDDGSVVATLLHRRLDGDARFVGLSKTGEQSVTMEGGPRHYFAHAPSAPTPAELDELGCSSDTCVISGCETVECVPDSDSTSVPAIGANIARKRSMNTAAAATGYAEDMEKYYSTPVIKYDPVAALSESERTALLAKQNKIAMTARASLEKELMDRGVAGEEPGVFIADEEPQVVAAVETVIEQDVEADY